MKSDAIEWYYSCIRNFVSEYISNTNRDFTGEKIEEIISNVPEIIRNFSDPTNEEEYRMLAKKQDGTLATIQIIDRSTGYKLYKQISSDEYKNFYYECLMYALIYYEMYFNGWKYEIIDEKNESAKGEFEVSEEQLPHLLGIESKYIGNCELLNQIIGDYNGKSPIEQILLIVENYEKIKNYEIRNNVEIFNYYKSMQKVKEFLLLGKFYNEYRSSRPEQFSLVIMDKDDSTNQMWLYKKSNMNDRMNRSIIKILIQLNSNGKFFPRSIQSISEDMDAIIDARRDLYNGVRIWSDLPTDVRGTLLSAHLIMEGEGMTPGQRIKLKENESMINQFIFGFHENAAAYVPLEDLNRFIKLLNDAMENDEKKIIISVNKSTRK